MRDGSRLASRAFAFSWLWSIGGVSFIAFAAWKLSGASDVSISSIDDELWDQNY